MLNIWTFFETTTWTVLLCELYLCIMFLHSVVHLYVIRSLAEFYTKLYPMETSHRLSWVKNPLSRPCSLVQGLSNFFDLRRFLRHFRGFWCTFRAPKCMLGRFGAFLGPPKGPQKAPKQPRYWTAHRAYALYTQMASPPPWKVLEV